MNPESGRSPGEGNDNCNPLQYSCWEVPWTKEPGGYSPWGPKVRNDWMSKQQQYTYIWIYLNLLKFLYKIWITYLCNVMRFAHC